MDINNFGPFRSDVWGTVSDWALVLFTMGTITGVFLTYRSQQRLFNLERFKLREASRPEFELSIEMSDAEVVENRFNLRIKFLFTLRLNRANNVKIKLAEREVQEFEAYVKQFIEIAPLRNMLVNDVFFIPPMPFNVDLLTRGDIKTFFITLTFIVCFDDILGNHYEQKIELILLDNETTIFKGVPELKNYAS